MIDGRYTRRGIFTGVLALGLAAVVSPLLAACASSTPSATTTPNVPATPAAASTSSAPAATSAPTSNGPVRVVVDGYGFMLKDVNMALFATKYNGTQNK